MRVLSRRTRWALIFLGMGIGVLVVLLVWAVVTSAVNSTETNERGESRESQVEANDQTLAIIKDCTQVSGKCYQRGQRRTAQVLSSAQKIIIISAACSASVDTTLTVDQRIAEITACVTERLTARPPKP